MEIIVVDNSPDPFISESERENYSHIPCLRWVYEQTPGLSNARNVATKLANSPITAFLDDDAIASPLWAENIIQTFKNFGPTCMVVGGKVRPLWVCPRPTWLSDKLLSYLSVIDYGEEQRFLDPKEWLAGANIAYRTETLLNLGGFQVSLGRTGSSNSLMSNEEVELTDKIRQARGLVVYTPEALVDHTIEPRRVSQRWFRQRVAWQAVSDCVRDASLAHIVSQESEVLWSAVKDYFLACEVTERSIRALAIEQNHSADFEWQLASIYNTIKVFLNGIHEKIDD